MPQGSILGCYLLFTWTIYVMSLRSSLCPDSVPDIAQKEGSGGPQHVALCMWSILDILCEPVSILNASF